MDVLEDYGYDYHDYYFNNDVNYFVDACFMYVIVYRHKPNIWLN
jgi:hypothetical protein